LDAFLEKKGLGKEDDVLRKNLDLNKGVVKSDVLDSLPGNPVVKIRRFFELNFSGILLLDINKVKNKILLTNSKNLQKI